MSNEFYNYIASNIISFFQNQNSTLRAGERYCLKLDNEKMVKGVDQALRDITEINNIQGTYSFNGVYSTFTIKLTPLIEIVVASKIDGMTDDFLATLRNTELTSKKFPILMITYSTIDTITSGTGDLTANGMPFHAKTIIANIKKEITDAQLATADRTLLEEELKRKEEDRFSDKSSLFEYYDLLTVLGKGYILPTDFPMFNLLPDSTIKNWEDPKKIASRLSDNHDLFDKINEVFKHGNINDSLSEDFDKELIKQIETAKKKNELWYNNVTYDMVKSSQDKLKKKLDNPLVILDHKISAYSNSPLEYIFEPDENFFVKSDGNTRSKQKKKNILIFNNDLKETVTIAIDTNITIKQSGIEAASGCECEIQSKRLEITLKPNGCSFSFVKVNDTNNNIKYVLKICVLDINPKYFENIQTSYILDITKSLNKPKIQVIGIKDSLILNPNSEQNEIFNIKQNEIINCSYDKTSILNIDEDELNPDNGKLDFEVKLGTIIIPMQIKDDFIKPTELTGIAVFKLKNQNKKSLELRSGNKIICGTNEYFAKEPFKSYLDIERQILQNKWLCAEETINGLSEISLLIKDEIKTKYLNLVNELNNNRTVPSLAFYRPESELYKCAKEYVYAVFEEFKNIKDGQTLTAEQNNLLLLGCIFNNSKSKIIEMSPLHPLNVMYQITLLNEEGLDTIRDNLVEKLTPLYLMPYIKDDGRILYNAVEQKYSPEWRVYAPTSNKQFHGSRNFVQKLVCEKIKEYKKHFDFLFDGIGNNLLYINLVNMGDCKEILNGIIKYYVELSKDGMEYDDMLDFGINIYTDKERYNEFSLLSDLHKLKVSIKSNFGDLDNLSELALAVTSKIKCYYKNPKDDKYVYSHLTFFEMASSENSGASRMDSITTGIALYGLTSGTPSVLNSDWYKTGFGTKYAVKNDLIDLSSLYNALYRVAFTGSSYESKSSIFTEIEQGQEGQLGKIYDSSNWVIFVDPKVDLSFFKDKNQTNDELMIIHYSDQYTSASGYDDITVTKKSNQYTEIITDQLQKKGVTADKTNVNEIISLFNAINGSWMLKLMTAKKNPGASDSNFSREKMSILSAIKLCMAYYTHKDITWIPISLEEMLRVSWGAGLSQNDGLLSAKNLGFDQKATSDDVLMVGIQGPVDNIKIYLHPVEVKIGQNPTTVLSKAKEQVTNTYKGLCDSLWPKYEKNIIERKLSRNFFMQLVIMCCEKLKLYNIYPEEDWDCVLDTFRENLLNEKYIISSNLETIIGKGTVVSFGSDVNNTSGEIDEDGICLLELPEKLGSEYMIKTASQIDEDLNKSASELPKRLKEEIIGLGENVVQPSDISVPKIISSIENYQDTVPVTVQDDEHKENDKKSESQICLSDNELSKEINVDPENNAEIVEEKKYEGMKILFGTNSVNGEKVIWNPNDTEQVFHCNTGIIGTMGTGKTQFTKSMITQLYNERFNNFGSDEIGILIFDYKGDYNESKEDFVKATNAKIYKPYHLPFNPLSLTQSRVFKPLLPTHTANAFKDTLSKVYGLGPKQQNTLTQCIMSAYASRGIISNRPDTWNNPAPTFSMVYDIYSSDDEIKKNDSLAAAMEKLASFEVFENKISETKSLFDVLKGVVVIDLSGYDSDIQSLIVAITLDLFYAQMQAAGSSKLNERYRQITKLILVDEADNFMSEGFPSLKKILKEGREFGVGTILSTQFLKHFGSGEDDYSKYILTWVVHNVADLKNTDIEFVFKVDPRSNEGVTLYNDIKRLNKHNSIIKIGNSSPKYTIDKAFWELYKELHTE